MQQIAWVLGHLSATDIVLIIHAWTLHRSDFALELRVGKLVLKLSKAERPKRAR